MGGARVTFDPRGNVRRRRRSGCFLSGCRQTTWCRVTSCQRQRGGGAWFQVLMEQRCGRPAGGAVALILPDPQGGKNIRIFIRIPAVFTCEQRPLLTGRLSVALPGHRTRLITDGMLLLLFLICAFPLRNAEAGIINPACFGLIKNLCDKAPPL